MHYAEFIQKILLIFITGIGAAKMTITLDFWQLLCSIGSVFVMFCGFQWWFMKQVAEATRKSTTITQKLSALEITLETTIKNSFHEMKIEIDGIKDDRQTFLIELKRLDDKIIGFENKALQRIEMLETKTIQRIEMLETLKRIEQFCVEIIMKLQIITGKPLDMKAPDLQTPVLNRQTFMDQRNM